MADQPDIRPAGEIKPRRGRGGWFRAILVVPTAILPLLPSATCPLCLAAYGAVLSSLGLGFMLSDSVQRPLIVSLLALSFGSVAWSTRRHRRFGPLGAVVLGSSAIIVARIVWDLPWMVYFGVASLVVGSVWNLVLKRPQRQLVQISPVST